MPARKVWCRQPSLTAEEIDSWAPVWPNPFLSFLWADAQPDWERWRARAQLSAHRRRINRRLPLCGNLVTESESPGVAGTNDLPVFGIPLQNVGAVPGNTECARVSGTVREAPTELAEIEEPNGAVQLAGEVDLDSEQTVAINSVIGDGLYGSGGTQSGDFDFYKVTLLENQLLEISVQTEMPLADLDPIVANLNSDGTIASWNDNVPLTGFLSTLDAYLDFSAPASADYFVVVGGFRPHTDWRQTLPSSTWNPASEPGVGSEGAYRLILSIDRRDSGGEDCYSLDLRAGDIVGATLNRGAWQIGVYDLHDEKLVAARARDLSAIFPDISPLPGGGTSTIAWMIDKDGRYAIRVHEIPFFWYEGYEAEIWVYRSPLDSSSIDSRQRLLIEFGGARSIVRSSAAWEAWLPCRRCRRS